MQDIKGQITINRRNMVRKRGLSPIRYGEETWSVPDSLIPVIGNVAKDKREVADNALRSVSHALTETCLYVNRYIEKGNRDEEVEAQLSRYWSAAAIPLRHIDQELSEICEYKSEYWLDPRHWDQRKTKGLAIDLESVREKYRTQLK